MSNIIIAIFDRPGGKRIASILASDEFEAFARTAKLRELDPSQGLYVRCDGQQICDGEGKGQAPRITNMYANLE